MKHRQRELRRIDLRPGDILALHGPVSPLEQAIAGSSAAAEVSPGRTGPDGSGSTRIASPDGSGSRGNPGSATPSGLAGPAAVVLPACSHVGLYLGSAGVIDARPERGVGLTALADWFAGRLVRAYRHPALDEPEQATPEAAAHHLVSLATGLVGQPYNPWFHPELPGYYCSQLVQRLFRQACGREIFPSSPMSFGSGPTLAWWREYYRQAPCPLPEGLPGTHPATLVACPELRLLAWTRSGVATPEGDTSN